jgi:hypothetical protein
MERETFCLCGRGAHWDSDLLMYHCFVHGYLANHQVIVKEPAFNLTTDGYQLLIGELAHLALKLTAKALAAIGELPNVDQQAS